VHERRRRDEYSEKVDDELGRETLAAKCIMGDGIRSKDDNTEGALRHRTTAEQETQSGKIALKRRKSSTCAQKTNKRLTGKGGNQDGGEHAAHRNKSQFDESLRVPKTLRVKPTAYKTPKHEKK